MWVQNITMETKKVAIFGSYIYINFKNPDSKKRKTTKSSPENVAKSLNMENFCSFLLQCELKSYQR